MSLMGGVVAGIKLVGMGSVRRSQKPVWLRWRLGRLGDTGRTSTQHTQLSCRRHAMPLGHVQALSTMQPILSTYLVHFLARPLQSGFFVAGNERRVGYGWRLIFG
jgi:hypothetical protein